MKQKPAVLPLASDVEKKISKTMSASDKLVRRPKA
jgi:hypothetical protein